MESGRQRGFVSRKGRLEAGAYKTRVQLEAALPDGIDEFEKLAINPMVEKAVLERELELTKGSRAAFRGNYRTGRRLR